MRLQLLLATMLGLVMLASGKAQAEGNCPPGMVLTNSPGAQGPVVCPSAAGHPGPGDVLDAIYHKASHGASSYEIADGGWATYWYGYAFVLNGRQYYTGFAYDIPRRSDDMASPDKKAAIAQATFESVSPDSRRTWSLVGAKRTIGAFGGSGKGYDIDEARHPQSYPTSNGKRLLAVPVWYLAMGTRVSSYELFAFDPSEPRAQGADWRYLGNIEAGEDNGAACDEADGGRIACAKSVGALEFLRQNSSDMPLARVVMSGTEIGDSGKVRALSPADVVEYRYDAAKMAYVTSRP